MATDNWAGSNKGLISPAYGASPVSKSDSVDLAQTGRALYVGFAGNVSVVMHDGGSVIFFAVPAGTVLPIRVSRVNSTNTTAASMVNMY